MITSPWTVSLKVVHFNATALRHSDASRVGAVDSIKRVGFPMSDVCPVYLHHRTCPEPVGTSHLGQSGHGHQIPSNQIQGGGFLHCAVVNLTMPR